MIAKADIRRVQEWMGHADVQTTMRYLHYAPRPDDAALVAEAFRRETGPGISLTATLMPRVGWHEQHVRRRSLQLASMHLIDASAI